MLRQTPLILKTMPQEIYHFKAVEPGVSENFEFHYSQLPDPENAAVAHCFYKRILPPGFAMEGPAAGNLVCVVLEGELASYYGAGLKKKMVGKKGDIVFVQDPDGYRIVKNEGTVPAVMLFFRVGLFDEKYLDPKHKPRKTADVFKPTGK